MDFSKNLYEFIYDHAAEGVFQSTPSGKYLYVNKAMARIYGYDSPEDMIQSVKDIASQIYLSREGREAFTRELAGGDIIENFEARNRRKDGSVIWTSTNARAVRDARGNVEYFFGFVQDITAHKETERALGETEARYRTLVEQVPAAVYIDPFNNTAEGGIYISPQIEVISGYPSEKWARSRTFWQSVVHTDDRETFIRKNEQTDKTGEPFDMEYRIVHRTGRVVWVRDMATLTRDPDGQPMYWHGVIIDVSEQKLFQDSLRVSEERFRKVFENSPIPISITTFDKGEFLDVNSAYLALCKYRREDILGQSLVGLGLMSAKERKGWLDDFVSHGQTMRGAMAKLKTADGETREVLEFFETIDLGGQKAIIAMYYDMTAQNKITKALQESEARYRALVENIPAIVFLDPIDPNSGTLYINGQIRPILGYSPDEWIRDRKVWQKAIHPDDRARVLGQEEVKVGKQRGRFSREYRLLAKDGRVIWVQEEVALIRDEQGTPLFWQGFLLDITKRKEDQEALRHSEERFKKIFHASPLGSCITKMKDGTFIDANEAYCDLVEYTREELIGATSVNLGIWESANAWSKVVRTLKVSSSLRELNTRFRTRTGKTRDLLSFYELVEIGNEPCILSIHYDTSSQQEAQEALREIAASYRGLFDSVSDAIYIQDQEGFFIDANRGAAEMYGQPVEFFLGKTPADLAAPGRNDLRQYEDAVGKAFGGEPQKFEFWGKRNNGEIFPEEIRLNKGVYFGQEVVFALAQDITQRKQAEKALLRREAILEAIAHASEKFLKNADWEKNAEDILARLGRAGEASRVYIFRNAIDPHGNRVANQIHEWCAPDIKPRSGNPYWKDFDFKKKDFLFFVDQMETGQAFTTLIQDLPLPARHEFEKENILSTLNAPIMVNNRWWGFIGYDECRYKRIWSQPETEALKAAASILGAVIERHEAAEALMRSEERFRMLIEQASDGIFICDADGKFLDANPSLLSMLGRKREELLLLDIFDIIDENDLARKPLTLNRLGQGETLTTERNLVREDGGLFPAEISIKRLPTSNYQGMARDITERRKFLDSQERQLKELSVLQALAVAGTNARDEDELIEQATEIIGRTIYTDIVGILIITESGDKFYPHPSYRGLAMPNLMHEYSFDEGIAGQVARTGQSINVPDVRTMENYIEVNPISLSELCVPMKIGERLIGMINAESSKVGYFTQDDERLLLTIAGQLATAIERLRSARAERDQRNLAEALRDTAEALNTSLEFNQVLDRILENIGRVVPSQTAMIMLLENGIARPIRHRGFAERESRNWIEELRIDCREMNGFRDAILTLKPQLIADTSKEAEWISLPQSSWIHSHLLAPILIDQSVIGFIALDHDKPGFFTERDKERLQAFSDQAATALQNARLFQSERQRRQEAETLREATAVVATTLNSSQAVTLILDQLARVLEYDSASVQLLRDGYLEIVGGRGWSDVAAILGMRFPIPGDNPNTMVVLERKPVIIESTRQTTYPFIKAPHDHILSWMGVPLVARGEVIGMLGVDSKEEHHFSEEHARLATAYANQAAITIENARLLEQNEEQIRRLVTLRDIDTAIASSLDLRVTLNILLDQALSQLKPDAIDIMVYNPHLQTLEMTAGVGFLSPSLRKQSRIGDGMAGTVAITRRMLQIPDLSAMPEFAKIRWVAEEKFVYYAGFPLLGKGQTKGVLEAYFRSPVSPNADWLDFMQTIAGQAAIAIDNAQLFENLQRSNLELSLAYDTTLEGWGKALELRDKETEGHTRRVAELTIQLARRMGIGEAEIIHIRRGVLLHDIGKMGVPDHILRKTGPLTDAEWEQMRLHPQYAYELLSPIAYLRPAVDIPYCHHEKWDGSGYPRGLKGTEIPLSARIFAVVDVWDALLSDRPYRSAWSREETIEYLKKESGTRFDPDIVRIFLELMSTQN